MLGRGGAEGIKHQSAPERLGSRRGENMYKHIKTHRRALHTRAHWESVAVTIQASTPVQSHSPSLPCEDAVRRWLSASREESHHQEPPGCHPDLSPPALGTVRNKVLVVHPPACDMLRWPLRSLIQKLVNPSPVFFLFL